MDSNQNILEYIDSQNLWSETKVYKRNEFIKTKGSIDTNSYFIVEGSVRIFIHHEEEEKIIRFGYKNSLVAALDSFLTNEPSPFIIQAIKKTTVKVLKKKTFDKLMNTIPEMRNEWHRRLEELALQQTEREIDILTNSPRERYLRVLKRSPQLFQEIPNKYIASYLRMSPETLSRMKKS